MKFQNPYHLFDIQVESPEEVTSSVLKRVRKKVLAEFELSGAAVADFKGHPMDRSTTLQLVESLEDPANCRNFFFLGKYPGLVRFLESGSLKDLRLLPPAIGVDPAFKQFVSRQMAPVVDTALMQHVKKTRWAAAKDVLKRLEWVESRDMDLVLQGSNRYYLRGVRELEQATEGGAEALRKTDLEHRYDAGLIDYLNQFPDEFLHLRNQYGKALRDYAIALDEAAERPDIGYKVITRASELQTDLTISERIRRTRTHLYSRKNAKRTSTVQPPFTPSSSTKKAATSEDKKATRRLIRVVAWVFAIVCIASLTVALMDDSGSDPYPRGLTIDEMLKESRAATKSLEPDDVVGEAIESDSLAIKLPDFSRIFFKLRDSLLESMQSPLALEVEAERPQTGFQPYGDFETAELGDPVQAEATFYNQSREDLVVFLEQMTLKDIYRHAYVRSGESYTFKNMPMGFFKAILHVGKEWKPNAVVFEDKKYPGFTEIIASQEPGKPAPGNQMFYVSPVLLFEEDTQWRDKYILKFAGDTLDQEKITKY